ncbi:MAG TPA: hypothetical protein VMP08_00755 [Anaerolineae bacterium]|nr:hypothetical protein [Anaerolineae bacterium]
MNRLTRSVVIALGILLIISLLAACANPIGSRAPVGSNQAPAAQPAKVAPAGTAIQPDPQADSIEQALNDLDQQLSTTDTLDDLK